MARRKDSNKVLSRGYLEKPVLIFTVILLVGCHNSDWARENDRLPYPAVWGRPTSIVFQSPGVHRLVEDRVLSHGESPPWYVSRNDVVPRVFAGYRTVTTSDVTNHTFDRQVTAGRRVRDHYFSSTRQRTVTRIVN